MDAKIFSPQFEQEVQQLSTMIEQKRDAWAEEYGVVEEKEVVRQAVREHLPEDSATPVAPVVRPATTTTVSYLETLDPASLATVHQLLQLVTTKGLQAAVDAARDHSPFILDAFHDAMVDQLYQELKRRGVVR